MKTPLKFIRTGTLIAALLLGTLSCKKDNSNTTGTETADENTTVTLASSSTNAETLYDDAFDVVVQSSEQSGVSVNSTSGLAVNSTSSTNALTATACAGVTLSPSDPSVFPKTMTIDYGAGCTSTNGITRKGKLTVSLSGKVRDAGTVISVAFDSYSVNGYVLTGSYALTPLVAAGGGVNYNITITNGSITLPAGGTYTYSGTETFTQTAGIGTPTVVDDTYGITGNFSYSGNGNNITGTVTSPLVRSADCPNITSGTIGFTYKNINGVLDFGSGTCDNIATVKAGLTTKTITLPR